MIAAFFHRGECRKMSQLLKEKIIQKSKEIGIDKIGFTHAEPFYELEDKLYAQQEKGHHSGFEHSVIEERVYPEKSSTKPNLLLRLRWLIHPK